MPTPLSLKEQRKNNHLDHIRVLTLGMSQLTNGGCLPSLNQITSYFKGLPPQKGHDRTPGPLHYSDLSQSLSEIKPENRPQHVALYDTLAAHSDTDLFFETYKLLLKHNKRHSHQIKIQVFKYLFKLFPNIERHLTETNRAGSSLLLLSLQQRWSDDYFLKAVHALKPKKELDILFFNICTPNAKGRTTLQYITAKGDQFAFDAFLNFLITQRAFKAIGTLLSQKTASGNSPLILAARVGSAYLCREIIRLSLRNALNELNHKNKKGLRAIDIAREKKQKLLADKHPADPAIVDQCIFAFGETIELLEKAHRRLKNVNEATRGLLPPRKTTSPSVTEVSATLFTGPPGLPIADAQKASQAPELTTSTARTSTI